MDEDRNLLHVIDLRVRWGDMDAVGHVNNAKYFTYFEQVRVAWLREAGVGEPTLASEQGPVIVTAQCTFHAAITYPAELQVRMYGARPGRSSFESFYEIHDAHEPGSLYAEGGAKVVWVDRRAGRSVPLPERIRALLGGGPNATSPPADSL